MLSYSLEMADDIDEYASEIKTKGYYGGVILKLSKQSMELEFYDLFRLTQEITERISSEKYFADQRVVVVAEVDRFHIEEAIRRLAARDFYEMLH